MNNNKIVKKIKCRIISTKKVKGDKRLKNKIKILEDKGEVTSWRMEPIKENIYKRISSKVLYNKRTEEKLLKIGIRKLPRMAELKFPN